MVAAFMKTGYVMGITTVVTGVTNPRNHALALMTKLGVLLMVNDQVIVSHQNIFVILKESGIAKMVMSY